jgi:tRNA nucleotidyltransferase (CCA-adding enzyme)
MEREIKLTSDEQELFDSLRKIIKKVAPGTTLRVAGGWVRDKLLGKASDDIDFMVDNMSGEKIARLITNELGLEGPHVVEANPDASKHLETAGAKIPVSSGYEFDLDFAMARQEVYDDESRIPEIKPATPEEDAFRRDLTINSLFYNIMSGELEDFTGTGLSDLEKNVIRTPLNPYKTFMDDPLRIFRTIRFASRYNGEIDPQTLAIMRDSNLHEAIAKKVSKERIEQELTKTLKGPNPVLALRLLKETGIMENIIAQAIQGTKFEGQMAPFDMDQNNPHHELSVWDHTIKVVENILDFYPDTDPEKRVIMILTALMHDLGKLYYKIHEDKGDKTSYSGHEKASGELAKLILKYLKFNNRMVDQISKLSHHHMRIHQVDRDKNLSEEKKRLTWMRKFIRKMGEEGVDAMDIMNHSIADSYSKKTAPVTQDIVDKYNLLKSQLQMAGENPNVDPGSGKIKPVLNGRDVMTILNIGGGPLVGRAIERVKELMDENPAISKEDATQIIKNEFLPQLPEEEKIRQASSCPKHLLFGRVDDIKAAIKEVNVDQAITLMTDLKEEGENDESVYENIASCMFDTLLIDSSKRNLNLLEYLFKKAERNFFNTELCVPVLGILLLLETGTEEKVIEEIGERMSNMANNDLQEMLKSLPPDAHHKKIIKSLRNGRRKRS